MATLIITDGPGGEQQFALGAHQIVMIGRDDGCTFQILDQQMSRRHMQVKSDGTGQGHVAVDFGSANGVLINGEKIEADTPLHDGDEIRIGATSIIYAKTDSPDAKTIRSVMRKRGERFRGTLLRNENEAS
jgi:pSer/pThr/pTyr-binding forkhead associated (FHA) protein